MKVDKFFDKINLKQNYVTDVKLTILRYRIKCNLKHVV